MSYKLHKSKDIEELCKKVHINKDFVKDFHFNKEEFKNKYRLIKLICTSKGNFKE